ncbi:DUF6233 domain-containing protein [Streptomyces sp. NPDC052492]|uniref:DUF6233 domain-containing protein n=1 Tax=Streptomyces sp. NPDC052492 TaxID=3365691 RepID=UPI0037D76B14
MDAVHAGDCWAATKSGRCRPASREQVVEALRHGVSACPHCRPDAALGSARQPVTVAVQAWGGAPRCLVKVQGQ